VQASKTTDVAKGNGVQLPRISSSASEPGCHANLNRGRSSDGLRLIMIFVVRVWSECISLPQPVSAFRFREKRALESADRKYSAGSNGTLKAVPVPGQIPRERLNYNTSDTRVIRCRAIDQTWILVYYNVHTTLKTQTECQLAVVLLAAGWQCE
jgi:hypothetical protein